MVYLIKAKRTTEFVTTLVDNPSLKEQDGARRSSGMLSFVLIFQMVCFTLLFADKPQLSEKQGTAFIVMVAFDGLIC